MANGTQKMGFEQLILPVDGMDPVDDGLGEPPIDPIDETFGAQPEFDRTDRRPFPCKVPNYQSVAGRCALALNGVALADDREELCANRCAVDAAGDPNRTEREREKLSEMLLMERSRDTADELGGVVVEIARHVPPPRSDNA